MDGLTPTEKKWLYTLCAFLLAMAVFYRNLGGFMFVALIAWTVYLIRTDEEE